MTGNEETIKLLHELQRQLDVQLEREKFLRETLIKLSTDVEELSDEVKQMRAMANRWKGGFVVLAGLGGIIGWILSTWSTFSSLFKG